MTPAAWFALAAVNVAYAIYHDNNDSPVMALVAQLGALGCLVAGFVVA